MHVLVKFLRNVMGSATEIDIGESYENGTLAIPTRVALTEMVHPQPPTHTQLENTTVVNFVNDELKKKCTKVINMRFYWITYRTNQKQFMIFWNPGNGNLCDYHTKKHTPAHHLLMSPIYLNGELSS